MEIGVSSDLLDSMLKVISFCSTSLSLPFLYYTPDEKLKHSVSAEVIGRADFFLVTYRYFS